MKGYFELMNENIVDLSKDLCVLHRKVDEIHAALYPLMKEDEQEKPITAGETPVVD